VFFCEIFGLFLDRCLYGRIWRGGIWRCEGIGVYLGVIKRKEMEAKECKCVKCGKEAVAFFPAVDIDIVGFPYCRECLDREKIKIWLMMGRKKDERTR